jgi:hypothetical protein
MERVIVMTSEPTGTNRFSKFVKPIFEIWEMVWDGDLQAEHGQDRDVRTRRMGC